MNDDQTLGDKTLSMAGVIRPPDRLEERLRRARPVVYVAAPWRAESRYAEEMNLRFAERVAIELALRGCAPICVHSMCSHWHGQFSLGELFEIDGSLIASADALFLAESNEARFASQGALLEARLAKELNKPVLTTYEMIEDFVREWRSTHGVQANAFADRTR